LRPLSILLAALLLSAAPDSPIADAAMRRDNAAVRALIAKGANVNGAQGDGMTALHWAAKHGDVEVTTLLLRANANVKAVTRIGAYTPLHVASEAGSGSIVSALLKAGADPAAVTTTGVTPLHLAALSGDVASVVALLDRGSNVNALEPEWGQTPLMLAAARGRTDAVRALLRRGADPRITAKVADLLALAAGDRVAKRERNQVLADLRKKDGADSVPGWRPNSRQVQQAVRASLQIEKQDPKLLAQQARNVAPAEEPTPAAVQNNGGDEDSPGYTELVGFQGGLTALLLAVRDGHTETVKVLVDAGAPINQPSAADRTSPLLLATINGHYDLAKTLLELGADPNIASNQGATPLYGVINKEWAPTSRTPQPAYQLNQKITYLDLMKALLDAKADPNVRLKKSLWYTTYNRDNLRVDFKGATPFWRAAYGTDVPAMKLLVAYGAKADIPTLKPAARAGRGGRGGAGAANAPRQDPSGLPPVPDDGPGIWAIQAAAGVGYGQGFASNDHRHAPDSWLPAVKYLVEELHADVNARDFNGFSALHFAAARGDNEMIKYLVSKGADVKVVARNGMTTVDMANGPVQRISPFLDTVALLESMGAKNNHKCVSC
jgi:uncharacterized protein